MDLSAETHGRPSSPISHPTIHNRRTEDLKRDWLVRFNKLVEASYHRSDLTVADLAKQLGLSTRSFSRKYKKCLSMTPMSYITEYRLGEAIRLLCEGEPVSNIALNIGFSTHSAFSRSFHQSFDCCPTAYVEKYLENNPNTDALSQKNR